MYISAIYLVSVLAHTFASAQSQDDTTVPVRIGLLLEDSTHLQARDAAMLAIRKWNAAGGSGGLQAELVVRSVEGPWGVGSNRTVELIYEEKVSAILGSLKGRNAHLAEQVAAKSRVPLISTWATDPTLSKAYVPWFYRCIPNDEQLAEFLLAELPVRDPSKIGLYVQDDYDARSAARAFIRLCALKTGTAPAGTCYDPDMTEEEFLLKMKSKDMEMILVFGNSDCVYSVLEASRKNQVHSGIVTTLGYNPGKTGGEQERPEANRVRFLSTGFGISGPGIRFREEFERAYGYPPGEMAAFAWDGMNILLEAIRRGGAATEELKSYLDGHSGFRGLTGSIRFDGFGNRKECNLLFLE